MIFTDGFITNSAGVVNRPVQKGTIVGGFSGIMPKKITKKKLTKAPPKKRKAEEAAEEEFEEEEDETTQGVSETDKPPHQGKARRAKQGPIGAEQAPPRSKSPASVAGDVEDYEDGDSQGGEGAEGGAGQEGKKKCRAQPILLTPEQEEDLIEWLIECTNMPSHRKLAIITICPCIRQCCLNDLVGK